MMHWAKWILFALLIYCAYIFGRDQGLPESRRMVALERRIYVLELHARAQQRQHPASEPQPQTPVE